MEMYLHVCVLFSIILGLGISPLLSGVARIVQHPKQFKVYWVHLLWALFVFLYLIHFWRWEFRLQTIQQWTFPLYFSIAMYAVLLFLLCVPLFLDEMAEYDGFKTYFYSRREWIFSLMRILFVADIVDTAIKGASYVHALGVFHYIRTSLDILLSAAAIKIKDERFHGRLAIFAVVCEVALILKYYMIMT
jgi:hypothetical protein